MTNSKTWVKKEWRLYDPNVEESTMLQLSTNLQKVKNATICWEKMKHNTSQKNISKMK
jgi:hypothetical protein